jgi:hypothetical protein
LFEISFAGLPKAAVAKEILLSFGGKPKDVVPLR